MSSLGQAADFADRYEDELRREASSMSAGIRAYQRGVDERAARDRAAAVAHQAVVDAAERAPHPYPGLADPIEPGTTDHEFEARRNGDHVVHTDDRDPREQDRAAEYARRFDAFGDARAA